MKKLHLISILMLCSFSSFSAVIESGKFVGNIEGTRRQCTIHFDLGSRDYASTGRVEYLLTETRVGAFNDCDGYERCVSGVQTNSSTNRERGLTIYLKKDGTIISIYFDADTNNPRRDNKSCVNFQRVN